jgi:UDP-glucose 4-epimerase
MKDINVIGTMQLLAACQRTPSVTSVVLKSTAGVYGSGPKNPARYAEDDEPAHAPRSGWPKDCAEVEGFVRGFARRRPDACITMLRLANIIGPRIRTGLTGYLSLPVIPTVLGFDARLQFIHEDDALEIIRRATLERIRGTFNVAGSGVMTLAQVVRRTGRPWVAVPAPLFTSVGRSLARAGDADFSAEQVRFLTYGRVLDTAKVEGAFGWHPRYTTAQALDDFLDRHGREGVTEVA